ncbi:hypothetical protein [Salinigranum halophilum]|jgi:hypothetical protein|uniref:hypothetical protein n=1 Tax=Salinigranum halophilum TaxID=2565931 RepID=UPI0010A788ED|nr:hypothetical protein [Salinigranum halophilum]
MADDGEDTSLLFTYVTPFVGVLLIAIGIGGAVPGGYALIQDELRDCDSPTIVVEPPERATELVENDGPQLQRLAFADLTDAEQEAFVEALDAPRREAHIHGSFANRAAFESGVIVTYQGERYYSTIVAENTCFRAPALGFPLGVFAIGLGTVAVLIPPVYRKLVELDERASRRRE